MTRQIKYDHAEIIRMYEAGEKMCVISAVLGCHQTTISKAINKANVKQRKPRRDYNLTEVILQSPNVQARRLAELLGTTTGYINKLRVVARKKALSQNE